MANGESTSNIVTPVLHRCSLTDLDNLIAISITTYKQHYEYLWDDLGKSYMQRQFSRSSMLNQLKDQNCQFFLVKLQHATIGVVKLIYDSPIPGFLKESCVEIQRIYLLNEYVGRGFGAKIFTQIENMVHRQSHPCIWLMAMDSSRARNFYEKQGYKVVKKSTLDLPYLKQHLKGMFIMLKEL